MSINKTLFQQKLDALKRAGSERRLRELQSKYQSPETIDYSNMSLRDELQTRFDLDEMNRLFAELSKDVNSVANISSNSANALANKLLSNDWDSHNSFSKPLSRPNNDNANCYMTFDGQNLELNGGNSSYQHTLDAMSGNPNYQAKKYQSVKDLGPIPEGTYYASQNQRQTIDPINPCLGTKKSLAYT